MSINVLQRYLSVCAAMGIEPSFIGLRAYRKAVVVC